MFVMLGHIGYLEKRSPANPGHRAVQVHTTLRTPMLRIRHALSLFSVASIVPHQISRCITPLVGDGRKAARLSFQNGFSGGVFPCAICSAIR